MIVCVRLEIGMELNVLYAHQIPTGMESFVLLVMVADCGILLTWFANVPMIHNGMVFPVLRPV